MAEPLSKNGWTREELESQILWCKGHIARLESRVVAAKSGLLAAQQELETLDASVPKVECWGADNPKDGPVKEYIWKNPDDLANGLSGVPINKEPFVPKSRIVEHTFEEFMGKEKNGKLNPLTPSGDELVHGDDPILEAFERGQKSRK